MYSTFFTAAHQDFYTLISNVVKATNCKDKTWLLVEKFEKPLKKVSYQTLCLVSNPPK